MSDLSESVGLTSRFIEQLKTSHFKILKGILRDIKGTMDHIDKKKETTRVIL